MTSQPRKQTIVIHILTNISRSKCNQAMKFGQLMGYNMRNIFREVSYTKCDRKTIPRPFRYLDDYSKTLYSLYLLYTTLRAIEIY